MLSSSRRLTTKLLGEVIKKGSIIHGTFLFLRIENTNSNTRFAISVPKTIAKTAVLRNLIKRRVYNAIYSIKDRIKEGKNVLIIAKKGLEKANFNEIKEEVNKTFVKSSILK